MIPSTSLFRFSLCLLTGVALTVRSVVAQPLPGSLDTSFDPGIGPNNSITFLTLQSDGKILIAGGFNQVDGTSAIRLARLNRAAFAIALTPLDHSAEHLLPLRG